MKPIIFAISFAFLAAQPLFSQADLIPGTHVGSGDPTTPDDNVIKLKVEITGKVDVVVHESKASADEILDWCSGASRILRREFEAAQRLVFNGKLEKASQLMVNALAAVNDSFSSENNSGGPMMKTLVYRGLQIIRVLDEQLPMDEQHKAFSIVTKAYFLERYVSFVLEMETYLDRPYWVNYRYKYNRGCEHPEHHDHCVPESFDIRSMMQRYLDMNARQLRFTNDFIDHKGNRPVTLGSSKAYLKIAELEASYAARDLKDNLYAIRNACEIVDLESLSLRLRDLNDNDRSEWFNSKPDAVQFAYTELNRVATSIESARKECEVENRRGR